MDNRLEQIAALCEGVSCGADENAVGLAVDVLALVHGFDANAPQVPARFGIRVGEVLREQGFIPA